MAFTTNDFNKIWASTSPLTPYDFSETNYKEGWNFIGGTPPARQMWDSIQKLNDEKSKFLYELAQMIVPVGVVQAFAGSTTPQGWLLCDGSAVSRTDYADLYAVIGDTYGAGDGTSTFNLPNLTDKFIEGSATSGTEKTAGLPNITGESTNNLIYQNDPAQRGALRNSNRELTQGFFASGSNTFAYTTINLDASQSNSVYGSSNTVQPPAITMRYVIKY